MYIASANARLPKYITNDNIPKCNNIQGVHPSQHPTNIPTPQKNPTQIPKKVYFQNPPRTNIQHPKQIPKKTTKNKSNILTKINKIIPIKNQSNTPLSPLKHQHNTNIHTLSL
jgi:CCR4-NOT transcriptional regulation complex NOT5 subunit